MSKHPTVSRRHSGFTIVELLIVIVIIAILAAITIVAFNGVQRRANESTVSSDLRSAATAIELAYVDAGTYPATLPVTVKASPKVTLTLKNAGAGVRYENLSTLQNSVLFQDTCLATITAGWGKKEDQPSNSFFTDCIVQEKTQLRLNGWNGGKYVVPPITPATLDAHVASYTGGSVPLYQEKATIFMTKWKELFLAQGGSFPVGTFWDPWATSTNGGVLKPSLPAPTVTGGASDGTTFCVEGRHSAHPELVMHVANGQAPRTGACS